MWETEAKKHVICPSLRWGTAARLGGEIRSPGLLHCSLLDGCGAEPTSLLGCFSQPSLQPGARGPELQPRRLGSSLSLWERAGRASCSGPAGNGCQQLRMRKWNRAGITLPPASVTEPHLPALPSPCQTPASLISPPLLHWAACRAEPRHMPAPTLRARSLQATQFLCSTEHPALTGMLLLLLLASALSCWGQEAGKWGSPAPYSDWLACGAAASPSDSPQPAGVSLSCSAFWLRLRALVQGSWDCRSK